MAYATGILYKFPETMAGHLLIKITNTYTLDPYHTPTELYNFNYYLRPILSYVSIRPLIL